MRLGWNRGAPVLVVLVAAGCYDWVPVRPTELPKLSAGARELERADGGRFEVRRAVTAKITTPWGATKFAQPQAGIEGGKLRISGGDVPPTEIPLDQITSVRVGQLNAIDTTASVVVLGALIAGSVLLFLAVRGTGNPDGGIK